LVEDSCAPRVSFCLLVYILCRVLQWKCLPTDIQSGVQPNKDAKATSSEHANRRDTRVVVTCAKRVRGRFWRASTTVIKFVFVGTICVSIKRSFIPRRRPRKFTFVARANRGFNEVVNSTLGHVREENGKSTIKSLRIFVKVHIPIRTWPSFVESR
jgi:hypothetical protein